MIADLHCHSNCSDGKLPPSGLPEHALASGAELFALTDHDTMSGIEEAKQAARKAGIGFLAGVEISSYYGCNVHVLGYRVDSSAPRFKDFEKKIARSRTARMKEMVSRLNRHGIEITYENVMKHASRSPSRIHVAQAMVEAGYEPTLQACFSDWLKEGSPCYVPMDMLTPFEALELIIACGGVPVLAHPMRLKLSLEEGEKLIAAMADFGLKGIEASYKNFEAEITRPFYEMAEKYDLFVTNGGDFHSPDRSKFVPRPLSEKTMRGLGLI